MTDHPTIDEMVADGVLLRTSRSVAINQQVGQAVTAIHYTHGADSLRIHLTDGSHLDVAALTVAEITTDEDGTTWWQWVDPQALAVVEDETVPLNDDLITVTCAIYGEGPVIIVDSARTADQSPRRLAVLIQGPPGTTRDGLLGAAEFLLAHAHDGLAERALAAAATDAQAPSFRSLLGYVVDTGEATPFETLWTQVGSVSTATTPPESTWPQPGLIVPIAQVTASEFRWAWALPHPTDDTGEQVPVIAENLRRFGWDKGLLPFTAPTLPRQVAEELRVVEIALRVLELSHHTTDPATGTIIAW